MNIIVAVDRKWAIGRDGQLLFTIPDDMRFFKKMTTGKVVVMGHATLRSLPKGKPLKDRVNMVLSRNRELVIEGAQVCHSLGELFSALDSYMDDDVWVIGGETVYRLLLPYCTDAYVTKVDAVAAADTFFPNLDESGDWQVADRSETFLHDGLPYAFVHYRCREPLKALQRPRDGSQLPDN